MKQSHWVEAKKLAEDFAPGFNVVYAMDHMEALRDTRLLVKPQDMSKDDWDVYKTTTRKIEDAIEALKECKESNPRWCKQCGCLLNTNDDLICGYHNLEA